jgi:hypothetical protein
MKNLQALCAVILLAAGCAFGQAPFGAIQGSVVAENGALLPGAVVLYSRVTRLVKVGSSYQPAPGETVVRRTVSCDANGAFSVSNLPVGEYLLCAEVPSGPYLDPCKWSLAQSTTVSAGSVARPTIVLKKGVLLKIRVIDPAGLLPPVKEDLLHPLNLIVGVVFGEGAFLRATNTGVDGTGRDYQISVPAGTPLKLWVFSRHVTLADSGGLPVDNSGAKIPFQATAGRDHVFTLHVSGRAAQAP